MAEERRVGLLPTLLIPFAFIGMLAVNSLANILPIGGMKTGQLAALYPALFMPAGYAFSIWSIIYLLLGASLFFQFSTAFRSSSIYRRFSIAFIINCILNAGWIVVWHHRLVSFSVIIIVLLAVTLYLMDRLLRELSGKFSGVQIWIHSAAVSIYFGWISVAVLVNIATLLVHWDAYRTGLPQTVVFLIMTGVALVLGLVRLIRHRDWLYSTVLVWGLLAIMVKLLQRSGEVHSMLPYLPLTAAVILIASGVYSALQTRKK